MPKLKTRLPKMCRDRNQAFSWHNGKRIYHGVWASPEAEKSYKRFIARLLESPEFLRLDRTDDVFVAELADSFTDFIAPRLDKSHTNHFKIVIGFLVERYGELAVDDFSPKRLRLVRDLMIQTGRFCRSTINDYTRRIIRIFQWGAEEELVDPSMAIALKTVKSLRKGEQGTFDRPPRQNVPDDVVRRTLPFFSSPTVSAMVQTQRLTGCRPSEIFNMRVGEIDTTRDSELWYYTPGSYKTGHFVGAIEFPLGKPEQDLIAPYLVGKRPEQAVFSPRTAMQEKSKRQRAERKSKLTPSQRERDRQRAEKPASDVGEFYDKDSYRRAVEYAIKKANRHLPEGEKVPHWTPYMLRHSAATATELSDGEEDAQALLGHTQSSTTKRYIKSQLTRREALARNRRNPFDVGDDDGEQD